MAKEKISPNVKTLQGVIHADTYGIDKKFLDEKDDIVRSANQSITNLMSKYSVMNNNFRGANPIEELSIIVGKAIRTNTLNKAEFVNKEDDGGDGFRSISYTGQLDSAELDVINSNAVLFQSFFSTVAEYKNVIKLIPEVERVLKITCRDILNPSELTKKAFNNVYDANVERNISKDVANKINEMIIKEVIEKNQLEKRAKKWMYEAAVAGVKPVAIIPYSHIIGQLSAYASRDKSKLIGDFKTSVESHNPCIFKTKSQKEEFATRAYESNFANIKNDDEKDDIYSDILDDDIVDSYYDMCRHDAEKSIESMISEYDNPSNLFSTEAMKIGEEVDKLKTNYTTWKDNLKKLPETDRRAKLRDKLKKLVDYIDDSITVTKPEVALVSEANKALRKSDRYDELKTLNIKLCNAPDEVANTKLITTNDGNPEFEDKMNDVVNENKLSINDEAIIIEYAPEAVIPIMVGSEYIGFYAIEYEGMYGPEWKNRRRTSSFTDFVSATGYRSDGDLVSGGGLMTNNAMDPIEGNAFSPVSMFNYNATKYVANGATQDDLKIETLKAIVLKTLSRKLKDPELANNKSFKDAVVNLLRNDYIVKKQIQFTFIPPENMVYMTYDEDENGVPKSIMDGTLFFAYMYISSKISSLMIKLLKSSDKEKYEVNVGLSKDIGMTIAEMQRNLSTRTLYTQSLFNNMGSVLRNSAVYQRVVIPIVKGEKLYDVTPLERMGNVDPDDDFTDKMLQSILLKMNVNPSMMSILDDADFAKSIMMRNDEYRSSIIESQSRFEPHFRKIIMLLTKYSNLPKLENSIDQKVNKDSKASQDNQNKKDEEVDYRIDINNINLRFNPPNYLTMTSITDNLQTASSAIDEITKSYNLDAGSGVADFANKNMRRELYKKLVSNIDWTEMDTLYKNAMDKAAVDYAKSKKNETITGGIDNPPESNTDKDSGSDTGTDTSDTSDDGGSSSGGDSSFNDNFDFNQQE